MGYQWIKRAFCTASAISIMILLLAGCNPAAKNSTPLTKIIPEGIAVELPITADYPEYSTPTEAINKADLAFVGKLVDITDTTIDIRLNPSTNPTEEDMSPYTIWTFECADLYKHKYLDPNSKTIRIKVIKSIDESYENVSGIRIGENYLILAGEYKGTGDKYLPTLINASQAIYALTSTVSTETVQRTPAPSGEMTGTPAFSAAEIIMTLETMNSENTN